MNAGLSTLEWLKARLLLAADAQEVVSDDAVAALGLGVAGHLEDMTGRRFGRVVDAVHEFDASRSFTLVQRYPIEAAGGIEVRESVSGGWVPWAGEYNFAGAAGMVMFGAAPGGAGSRGRLTYTGGWWWNTNEDAEDAMPAGAMAAPEGMRLAWVQACQFLWDRGTIESRAKAGFTNDELERFVTGESAWPQFVRDAIARHRSALT